MDQIVYADRYGDIIDRPEAGFVELRWFDTTAAMSRPEFEKFLATFAGFVERLRRPGVLVDGTSYKLNPEFMDCEWRDANIVPRYSAAGVKRFAFHFPEGMPAIGAPPAVEGAAAYPTAYFGTRASAVGWLRS